VALEDVRQLLSVVCKVKGVRDRMSDPSGIVRFRKDETEQERSSQCVNTGEPLQRLAYEAATTTPVQ
jgi:hypothetical protein